MAVACIHTDSRESASSEREAEIYWSSSWRSIWRMNPWTIDHVNPIQNSSRSSRSSFRVPIRGSLVTLLSRSFWLCSRILSHTRVQCYSVNVYTHTFYSRTDAHVTLIVTSIAYNSTLLLNWMSLTTWTQFCLSIVWIRSHPTPSYSNLPPGPSFLPILISLLLVGLLLL